MEITQQTIIGLLASVLTAISLVPQVVKAIRKKETGDISLIMLLTLFTGHGCWIYYGIIKEDLIITGSNTFSIIIDCITAYLVFKYRKDS